MEDLDSETAMALTLYGIWGLNELAYDEALNLSRSLNINLAAKNGGYQVEKQTIGINTQTSGRGRQRQDPGTASFYAPLIRNGSKLRLARPEERHEKRLNNPQTDWDILQGMLVAHAHGDIPVVRPYLEKYAPNHSQRILDLLQVWITEMDDEDMKQKGQMLLFGLGG